MTLYMTGHHGLYRIRLKIPGLTPRIPRWATNREDDKAIKEVVELERRKSEAELKRDLHTVEEIVAHDYIQVFGPGEPGNKETLIGTLKSPDLKLETIHSDLLEARVYKEVVVLFDQTTINASFQSQDISGHFRFVRLYAKTLNKWHCVAIQATPIS